MAENVILQAILSHHIDAMRKAISLNGCVFMGKDGENNCRAYCKDMKSTNLTMNLIINKERRFYLGVSLRAKQLVGVNCMQVVARGTVNNLLRVLS